MKKQILRAAVLAIITLFSYTFADAQTTSIVANVPFDFYVGSKKMPAGKYVIEKLLPQSDKTTLSLRSENAKMHVMFMTTPFTVARKGEPTLLFNRYGDVRYLSEIRSPFAEFGARLRQDKTEINLAREFGKSKRETASLKLTGKQNAETAVSN
jgi:hypothetical protein